MIDFRSLNNVLNSYRKELLPILLPRGKIEGHEYTALNPRRYDTNLGSFRINIRSLIWCDFATGDKGKGFISLYCYIKNVKPLKAAKALANLANIQPSAIKWKGQSERNSASTSSNPHLDPGIRKLILKIWHSSTNSSDTIVEKYLQKRAIKGEVPPTIRYLANCAHKVTATHWPCMLAAVTRWPEQKIIALHRTYLNADGSDKAPINPCKMMIGKTYGGAVRLSPITEELIIAEGLETALSLNFLSTSKKCSVWAVLSASGYLNLVLPSLPLAASIIIAADNDPAGIKAAKIAATKWVREGRKVKIALPPENSDFNDILVKDDIWE